MIFIEQTPESALGPLNDVERKNAPKQFFMLGDTSLLADGTRVSIVGSRKASSEALKRASSLSKILSAYNIIIVSGLAEGIDTAAHLGAINTGGKTIAVIGTSLDQSYPTSNEELQTLIGEKHLLVSQFPIGYPSGRKNFPMRNRTMALISDATVIVEAQGGSGTLHQGWEALRLGRPLFIMESILSDKSLNWPLEMINYGAKVLSRDGVIDLIECLPKGSRVELAAFTF